MGSFQFFKTPPARLQRTRNRTAPAFVRTTFSAPTQLHPVLHTQPQYRQNYTSSPRSQKTAAHF